ncbi:MAG TPA: hypothetical protein VGR27_05770, partial [Longimicrobiaceae bacterium]|nr:hypothetical protein [Longimicrobiaceae bacterium]
MKEAAISGAARALLCFALLLLVVPLSGMRAAERTVRLEITGQVIAADGGSIAGLRLFVRGLSFEDSVEIAPSGRFVLPLPATLARDSVELVVDAAHRARRAYHPSLVRLGGEDLAREQRFVLIPRRWRIPSGRHAGTTVEISPQRAFTPACRGCSGFYTGETALPDPAQRLVEGWPEAVFPLRVAFDRENSVGAISGRDSVAFWRVAQKMEEDIGSRLFRPARYLETLPHEGVAPPDVVLVWIMPTIRLAGLSTRGGFDGDILFAGLRLQRASLITSPQGPGLVAHELMHVLGFGHTCSWRSVLAEGSH